MNWLLWLNGVLARFEARVEASIEASVLALIEVSIQILAMSRHGPESRALPAAQSEPDWETAA